MRRTRGDLRARVVLALEAYHCGDVMLLVRVLEDLEHDLRDDVSARRRRYRCATCRVGFRWPGELDHHLRLGGCAGSGHEGKAA